MWGFADVSLSPSRKKNASVFPEALSTSPIAGQHGNSHCLLEC
jgi:hypothetical protein